MAARDYTLYPDEDPNRDDPYAPMASATEPWRWVQGTPPPRSPKAGSYWAWQGGFGDPKGQGWQEVPTGGYAGGSPFAETVQSQVPDDPAGQGQFGLTYWKGQGVTPDQIFNLANGQLNPGWIRTANGYERGTTLGAALPGPKPVREPTADAPPADVPKSTAGGGGGAMPGDPYASGAKDFMWPDWKSAGAFQPRNPTFSFDPYKASSWADAEQEPGYAASRTQLRKQIEAGAAHRGVLRSGMTIGDVYSHLDALGQQNFRNFDERNYRNWQGNRDNAALAFGVNLGVDRDVYDRGATDVDRGNNYRFNVASSQFQDRLSRWQEMVRSLTQMSTAGAQS